MSLNLFFFLVIAVAIFCISIPNKIIDTSNCTRHWLAILTIIASIVGIRGYVEISFLIFFVLLTVIALVHIHKVIKQVKHIEIK